jgi:hypothetical protein
MFDVAHGKTINRILTFVDDTRCVSLSPSRSNSAHQIPEYWSLQVMFFSFAYLCGNTGSGRNFAKYETTKIIFK